MGIEEQLTEQLRQLTSVLEKFLDQTGGGSGSLISGFMGRGGGASLESIDSKIKEIRYGINQQNTHSEREKKIDEARRKAEEDYFKQTTDTMKGVYTQLVKSHNLYKQNLKEQSTQTARDEASTKRLEGVKEQLRLSNALGEQVREKLTSVEEANRKIVPHVQQILQQQGKEQTVAGSRGVQNLEQAYAAQEQVRQTRILAEQMRTAIDRGDVYEGIAYQEKAQEFGKSLGLSQQIIDDFVNNIENSNKKIRDAHDEVSESYEQLHVNLDELNAGLAKAKGSLSDFAAEAGLSSYWLKQFGEELVSTAQASAKFGGQMENLFGSALWGMSSEELSELQGQYRQTTMAFQSGRGAIDNWEQRINESGWQMAAFTGGIKESVELNAHLVDVFKTFGDQTRSSTAFLHEQQNMFKNWNRVFGMTADQFQQMNEQLLQSQTVRQQLYKIEQDRRGAYFKDLQLTYQRLRSQGLLHEQAMQTVEALSEIGGQDAKTRIEQAAKLQAVMGAQGMGQMGARMADLLRGGMRGEGEQQQFAQMAGRASEVISQRMQQGLTSELVTGQMIQQAGLEKYLGPDSPFANVELQQQKAISEEVSATKNLTQELTKLRKQLETGPTGAQGALAGGGQVVSQLMSGASGAALMGAGSVLATRYAKPLMNFVSGKGLGTPTGVGGGATGAAQQAMNTATGRRAGAPYVPGLSDNAARTSTRMSPLGGTAAQKTQTAGAPLSTKGALAGGGRAATGGLLRSFAGKAIPGVGALLGLTQAAQQSQRGNNFGAALSGAGSLAMLAPALASNPIGWGIGALGGVATLASMFTGGDKTGGQSSKRLQDAQEQSNKAAELLERNNRLLEQVASNTGQDADYTHQAAENTRKSAWIMERQSERERQREDEEKARLKRAEASQKVNSPLGNRSNVYGARG